MNGNLGGLGVIPGTMGLNGQQINVGEIAEKFGINEQTFNEFGQQFAPEIAAAAELDVSVVEKAIPLIGKIIYSGEPLVDEEGNINITQEELSTIMEIALPYIGEYFGIPPQITNMLSPQVSEMLSGAAIGYINPNAEVNENSLNQTETPQQNIISEDNLKKVGESLWSKKIGGQENLVDAKNILSSNENQKAQILEESEKALNEEKKEDIINQEKELEQEKKNTEQPNINIEPIVNDNEKINNSLNSDIETIEQPKEKLADINTEEHSKNVFAVIENREFVNKVKNIFDGQNLSNPFEQKQEELEKKEELNTKFNLAGEECKITIKKEPIKLFSQGFKFLATKASQGLVNASLWVKEAYYDYKAQMETENPNQLDEFLVNTNDENDIVQAIDPITGEEKAVFKKSENVKML